MPLSSNTGTMHDRYGLTRRAMRLFLPLILLLAVINSALLVSGGQQAHLQIEQTMLHSLRMLREGSLIIEDALSTELTDGLQVFLAEYEAHDKQIDQIDLADLQQRLGGSVDVYAVDQYGVVQYSTLAQDIGLDFKQWPDFAAYLDEIRIAGELRIDSISKESKTGLLRKYGYLPTSDKLWLLELGIKPEVVARYLAPFDPVLVAQRLMSDHPHLNRLRIIDRHGWQLSMTQPEQVEPEVFLRVLRVLETGEPIKCRFWNRSVRYLPMPDSVGDGAFGLRMQVVEFDYNYNWMLFGVGINLLIAGAAIVLVLRFSRWMRLSENRLHAAREAAEEANLKLTELSETDGLTGIANRRRFDDFAAAEWARSVRNTSPTAVLLLDVDWFKPYNDHHGHLAGDAALKQIAQLLHAQARRPGDLAARYGGEEFVVILADTSTQAAMEMAEKIRSGVEALALLHTDSSHGVVTVSVGVAVSEPDKPATLGALIEAADAALYKAKKLGRNRVEFV